MRAGEIDQRLIEALADGISGRRDLRERIGCLDGDLSDAIRRGRNRGLIDFRVLALTEGCAARIHAGRAEAQRADVAPTRSEPRLPKPPVALRAVPPTKFADPCIRGVTRTRNPAAAIRAMAAEMELADPLTARRAMVDAWPDIYSAIEEHASATGTRAFPLLLKALAIGLSTMSVAALDGQKAA